MIEDATWLDIFLRYLFEWNIYLCMVSGNFLLLLSLLLGKLYLRTFLWVTVVTVYKLEKVVFSSDYICFSSS